MVYKRSEYGKEFKVSKLVKNLPIYKEHLSYRHLRRERECAHTPISWDGELPTESSDSDERISPSAEVEKLPISELVISEEEDENEEDDNVNGVDEEEEDEVAKEKREAIAKDSESKPVNDEVCDVDIVKQNDNLRKSAIEKLQKYTSQENTDKVATAKVVPEKKFCKYFINLFQLRESSWLFRTGKRLSCFWQW